MMFHRNILGGDDFLLLVWENGSEAWQDLLINNRVQEGTSGWIISQSSGGNSKW